MNKTNKQTKQKQTHRYREQTDSYYMGGLGEKDEGIKKKLIDSDNIMVITGGKGGWWEGKEGKEGINGDRRLDLRG